MTINKELRPKVFATLPVLNEQENIPVIINNLLEQKDVDAELIICVNQPDEWWEISEKRQICENNSKTMEYIRSLGDSRITLIDKSSPSNGWIGRKHGVGWARKTAMDLASLKADAGDLIISVDADTYYPEDYFINVVGSFSSNPEGVGFSAPYYHQLTSDQLANRCILRYELYMRNYDLNMLLIRNPYSFAAIGSGMACRAGMYRKVCGLTPKMSGEDFYFIQKLRKSGPIIIDCESIIYPASRYSDRVYFGTGPAMIKGKSGNWESYPIYSQDLFLEVKATFDSFEGLYSQHIETPMDSFLKEAFLIENDIQDLWNPLRENVSNPYFFSKAATHKVDALRILQFLKQAEKNDDSRQEMRLVDFLSNNFETDDLINEAFDELLEKGFENVSITNLNLIRDFMFVKERTLQRKAKLA